MTVIPGFAPDLLAGRTALITGGARGIGLAIAEAMLACGASPILADIDGEAASSAAQALGGKARGVSLDVADAAACRRLAEDVKCVSILVNNAGIYRKGATSSAAAAKIWDETMTVNAAGPYHMVGAFLPQLAESRGAIVNIASSRAFTAAQGATAYSVSKAAVVMLTKSLAVELAGQGIRVNAVAPSDVMTAMTEGLYADPELGPKLMARTPLGRPAEPHEIASAVVFLASPLASFITGSVLSVDGGFLAT